MEPDIMDPPSWDDYPDPVADQVPVIEPAPDVEPETGHIMASSAPLVDAGGIDSLADLIAEKVVSKLSGEAIVREES